MITVNCGFSRKVRRPHKRTIIEHKNVTGIKLPLEWDCGDHSAIRRALMIHAPAGDGWGISGYALVTPEDKPVRSFPRYAGVDYIETVK